ncbi:MAG TPA: DUF1848 domain-containing protein [Candidatus Methanoperedens sp.]|nr:DUF1848 domain-containing protein [Candidatus Methanoperedens sp.]
MIFKGWEKVQIETDERKIIDGIAPIIISASRSTDIPAFHSKWFIHRLNKGYIKWTNPFNRVPQYVSFEKTRVIVFWTKNAAPMLPFLKEIDDKRINYYFQFTLNDYEKEGFEPSVPKLEERIATFKKLSDLIGKEKVIWRFDPLILTDTIGIEELLNKVEKVGNAIHNHTNKLVISFADIEPYAKVKRNLIAAGFKYEDFDKDSMDKISEGIQKINEKWGLEIATCAEISDFDKYNIKHNKCIDDDLMIKLFGNDSLLMDFLYAKKENKVGLAAFGGGSEPEITKDTKLKDKGQRKECGCVVSKDIGQYNTCGHLCVYCYANYSENVVHKNLDGRQIYTGESILNN